MSLAHPTGVRDTLSTASKCRTRFVPHQALPTSVPTACKGRAPRGRAAPQWKSSPLTLPLPQLLGACQFSSHLDDLSHFEPCFSWAPVIFPLGFTLPDSQWLLLLGSPSIPFPLDFHRMSWSIPTGSSTPCLLPIPDLKPGCLSPAHLSGCSASPCLKCSK